MVFLGCLKIEAQKTFFSNFHCLYVCVNVYEFTMGSKSLQRQEMKLDWKSVYMQTSSW